MRAMQKAKEIIQNNSTGITRTLIAGGTLIIALTTAILVGGMRIGKTEQCLENVYNTVDSIKARQEKNEGIIEEMRVKQAFLEGEVKTKLENLEKTVNKIENIVSSWEPNYDKKTP